jgi:hypothetical protein
MATRHPARTRLPRRFRPQVEVLESRLPLAGNVVAVQHGANLYLDGDDDFNHLWITGSGEGSFVVEALATNLNGQWGATLSFSGVANIYMNLRGGDDRAAFVQTKLPGTFVFRGGDGNDDLRFDWGAVGDHSFGRFMAFLGAGDDTISALGEKSFTVRQSFVVHGGPGNNWIDLRAEVSVTLGSVAIVGGVNNDYVQLGQGLLNTRSIVMIGGAGDNSLAISPGANIDGNIIQTGGGGQDGLGSSTESERVTNINGAILMHFGDGVNVFGFANSTNMNGPVQYRGGNGDDLIGLFANYPLFPHFTAGDMDLQLGNGNNDVGFNQSTSVVRSLKVNTGSGNDKILLAGFKSAGDVALSVGDGDNELGVISSEFFGAFSWNSGSGRDVAFLESGYQPDGRETVFHASFFLSFGDGNDEVLVAYASPTTDRLQFKGTVFFGGGLGNDLFDTTGDEEYDFPPLIDSF